MITKTINEMDFRELDQLVNEHIPAAKKEYSFPEFSEK